MDLTETDDIKRWQEYTELYRKDLHDPDNHNDVNTHLEPDILECEVKWALGSNTLESPLDSREIQPVHPKGNQFWILIGKTDAEAEIPILWPPDAKS